MVKITYGEIAKDAIEQSKIDTYGYTDFSNISQLKGNLVFPNYSNPCDGYSVLLDGNALPLNIDTSEVNIGYWSNAISTNDFSEEAKGFYFDGVSRIQMMLTTVDAFSTRGFTLIFDKNNDIYPTHVEVAWLTKNGVPISNKTFYPNSSEYFFANSVNDFGIVVFNFFALSVPKGRLKIQTIKYGLETEFTEDEIRSIKISKEINPISVELPISTCSFSINTNKNIGGTLGEGSKVDLYRDEVLEFSAFVQNTQRKSQTLYNVRAQDLLSVLDNNYYVGGIFDGKEAWKIADEIFGFATYDYVYRMDDELQNVTVSGYIPYCTQREALQQLAFAIGAIIDASKFPYVQILKMPATSSKYIGKDRIMQGQTFAEKEKYSSVELTMHEYSKTSNETVVLYEATRKGVGEKILVIFDKPMYDLTIENGSIFQATASRAVIDAMEGCVLNGKEYTHTTTVRKKTNPSVLREKALKIDGATLISSTNVDSVLDMCYNYIEKNTEIHSKIIERNFVRYGDAAKYGSKKYGTFKYGEIQKTKIKDLPIEVGELITIGGDYLGDIDCFIEKQSYNLKNGLIVKDVIAR